jgi:hypothetical protein
MDMTMTSDDVIAILDLPMKRWWSRSWRRVQRQPELAEAFAWADDDEALMGEGGVCQRAGLPPWSTCWFQMKTSLPYGSIAS